MYFRPWSDRDSTAHILVGPSSEVEAMTLVRPVVKAAVVPAASQGAESSLILVQKVGISSDMNKHG